jgi:hypothetical protein
LKDKGLQLKKSRKNEKTRKNTQNTFHRTPVFLQKRAFSDGYFSRRGTLRRQGALAGQAESTEKEMGISREWAAAFERYLKSRSDRAFLHRRF